MFHLKKSDIIDSYQKTMSYAEDSFINKNFEKCLGFVESAASLAYNHNIFYKDDKAESLLNNLAQQILIDQYRFEKNSSKRIVFYDYFGLANRGLTQQYLRALISSDYEVLYVLENYSKYADPILNELAGNDKVKVYILNQNLSKVEKIKTLFKVINEFQPNKALLHLYPASVVAVTIWNMFPQVTRYQVNLTDHAFWLGVNCIDYNIEFREYGYTVSTEKRGIASSQIKMQPFYPILKCGEYKGLPPIVEGKIKIFTGGAFYKMYGDDDAFFKIMKGLLDKSDDVIIIIAGDGNDLPIKNFIKANAYENKIILIGKRDDVNHVFEACDIYLSTYPITGGLMSQFAAVNEKSILSYSSNEIACNDLDGFLSVNKPNDKVITYHEWDSFFSYAEKLIKDKQFRFEEGKALKNRVISVDEFNDLLVKNLEENTPKFFESVKINYDRFSDLYIEVSNKYTFPFHKILLKRFKLKAFVVFPKYFFNFGVFIVVYREILNPKLKSILQIKS